MTAQHHPSRPATAHTETPPSPWRRRLAWIGIELDVVSTTEKLVSGLGGFVALLGILAISRHALGLEQPAMLIASMGASAVLLFAVPHGQLSQPWPVIAGHVVAALLGVTCARFISNLDVAAALAVGSTITAMHIGKFIHPPGGATALTAVIGGPAVRALGYGFVLRPVALGATSIVAVAVTFNAFFPWRRYPAALRRPRPLTRETAARLEADGGAADGEAAAISHGAVVTALRSIDSFLDIDEADIVRLHLALNHHHATATATEPTQP